MTEPTEQRPCEACTDPDACWRGNEPCTLSGEIRDRETGNWIEPSLLAHLVHYRNQERLPMWTVYRPGPSAHATLWTVRLFWSLPEPEATHFVMAATSLERLRGGLPVGTYRLDRSTGDAPEIVETWL